MHSDQKKTNRNASLQKQRGVVTLSEKKLLTGRTGSDPRSLTAHSTAR